MPSARKALKLTPPQQTFIVTALACFDSPTTVVKAVKEEFGVEISRQLVETYDPTKRACTTGHSVKWKTLFDEARKSFLEDTTAIGISHRAVRLRALERMARLAETQGNLKLAAEMHRQAAEDLGGVYTNRRELGGKDGAPLIPPGAVTIFALPDNGRGGGPTD